MREQIVAAVFSSPDFLLLALILAIIALVQGIRILWKLLDWLEKTLRSASGRLGALAVLTFGLALLGEVIGDVLGQVVALMLTGVGWNLWRRSAAAS